MSLETAPEPQTLPGTNLGSDFSPTLAWHMIPSSVASMAKSPSYTSLLSDSTTADAATPVT